MTKSLKYNLFRIVLFILLGIIACSIFILSWLSYHYKDIVRNKLPGIITNSTDSIYHISYNDITIDFYSGNVTITGIKLWPDHQQVKALKEQHRHTPPTLSTVSIEKLEALGISWKSIFINKSVDISNSKVYGLKWTMVCMPNPKDSLYTKDKDKTPFIKGITSETVNVEHPDITYHFEGAKDSFSCFMKGGSATLDKWAYYNDQKIDTSVFLYAKSGKVRLDSFIFLKSTGRYGIKRPDIDFESTNNTVTLKEIKIKNMADRDVRTGQEKEIYNISLPRIEMMGFNWNKLINDGKLLIPELNSNAPLIDIHYIRAASVPSTKMGSYPHQLLLQAGMQINISRFNIKEGTFKYTEVTKKNDQGLIQFDHIHGSFTHITNMRSLIAHHKNCIVKLTGKFMDKSEVSADFNLGLADTTGRFTMDGFIKDMDGDEVTKQAEAFTFIAVTSFHLTRMDYHIDGDERNANGKFTVLYENLKLSLFKFKSNMRQGKHGLFSFLGSSIILYPNNPMPGKDTRTVTTSFARDPTKGFIDLIWKSMYRAVKKTAVRDQGLVTLTDGKENGDEAPKKKGFFKRLFGRKKKDNDDAK